MPVTYAAGTGTPPHAVASAGRRLALLTAPSQAGTVTPVAEDHAGEGLTPAHLCSFQLLRGRNHPSGSLVPVGCLASAGTIEAVRLAVGSLLGDLAAVPDQETAGTGELVDLTG